MAAPKVATRRAAVKLPRKGDVGHVLVGVGHYFECSCGVKGSRQSSYRAAMQDGREHAAEHTSEAS